MGIDKKWNISIGSLEKGPRNLISDVEGVTVGHCTLADGNVQTGVTALKPHQGNTYRDKLMAASVVFNGQEKSVGLVEVDDLGYIETPLMLTNTLSVGTVSTEVIRYMMEQNEDIGDTTGSVNSVVFECNDCELNDMRGLHVKGEHVRAALADCKEDFEEGAVGAGRGMKCHDLKGGIGSASRVFELDGKTFTLGVLTMTNHAKFEDLIVGGDPIGTKWENPYPSGTIRPSEKDKGSCITIIATDCPLSERQLKRIAKRAIAGLSRTGSFMANGSGEIALAFTTANRKPHYTDKAILPMALLHDDQLDVVFRAVIEATEEAVISSMLHAETVSGRKGMKLISLAEILSSETD